MAKWPGMMAALILALGACATMPPEEDGSELESISYETGPCFGACPVYALTVDADGTGTFEGRRFAAVEGRREFRITPAEFRAFARHLEPLRPASGEVRHSGEMCGMMATDLPSAEVAWHGRDGARQLLYFYYGCDMDKNRAMAERLERAPDLLPIASFIRRGDN